MARRGRHARAGVSQLRQRAERLRAHLVVVDPTQEPVEGPIRM
jgi:hypothetical protein